ncbi:MAG: dephospho-CoA kinase [Acidobacteria bacterium]|nr:MAG: dephospho-CoA kinase [Acidobacteriota bacterium]
MRWLSYTGLLSPVSCLPSPVSRLLSLVFRLMKKIGLTGSIAVGKSFVCDVFRELGCAVLDADEVARDVVEPGTIGLQRVVEAFGDSILNADGSLDRPKLGSIVFSDEEKRLLLNSIVHPLVFESQNAWLEEVESIDPDAIAIVDAALMIESGGYKRFEKLIVVWCEPELQLQRLMARDGISKEVAQKRIAAQLPQDEKKRFANFLIDTSKGYDDTRRETTEIFRQLKLSR